MKPWLRLFRAVNLPTVPGDIWVGIAAGWFGYGIFADSGVPILTATLALVFAYMFGLVDNDIVGAKTDRGRPIADGEISLTAARIARAVCLVLTAVCIRLRDPIAGVNLRGATLVFGALVLCIVGYNRTKWWWLMGACRALGVLAGGMAVDSSAGFTPNPYPLGIVVAIWFVYVAAITRYSEGEENDPAKKRRVGFLVGAIVYLQIVALMYLGSPLVVGMAVMLALLMLMRRFAPWISAS